MEHSRNFEGFKKIAPLLQVEMDFSNKYGIFFMIDSTIKQVVSWNLLNRKQPYTEEFFKNYFAKRKIEELMEFLLPNVDNLETLIKKAKLFGLNISPKQKHVYLQFGGVKVKETDLDQKNLYDVEFFQDYFEKRKDLKVTEVKDLVQVYQEEKFSKEKHSEETRSFGSPIQCSGETEILFMNLR